ncbi:uncharacterized protein LOC116893529 [Rattus rattus]|uniref:uncharacterized protein LOC116893529 n=1 Tax=Rattus rattus TaxID=10117 RepID=UPI0013F307CF|nr:uncharacterized protein LOC116893529 [Rattus rattus]
MGFLTGQEEPIPNYTCRHGSPQAALVGDTRSSLSVSMARLLGLYKFSQISYSSSLPSLSDKIQFPSFLRTLPSDLTSCHALTQLIIHFQWSWVIILAQDDDFGQQASSLATQQLSAASVCTEFHLHVPSQQSLGKIEETVQKMQKCTARVVLVFLSNSDFQLILSGLLAASVSGQVWVSSDPLHMTLSLSIPGVSQVLQGTFGLLYHSSRAIGFPEFFAHLHPNQTPEDIFIKKFWEYTFDCTWPYQNSTVTEGVQVCSGNESLKNKPHPFPEVSKIDAAYTAVYSIAHALHQDGKGTNPQDFHHWQMNPVPMGLPLYNLKLPSTFNFHTKRCLLCPKEQYSSHTRDHCLPRTEIFLAFEEPLGFILALMAILLAGLALLVLGMFLKHRDTPVVRANNRTLSYFLLISLSLCSLCSLLFLGRPTVTTCLLCQTTFAVVFTVAVSSVLAKTLTVVLAFRVTKPGSRIQVCLSPGASTSVVLIASLIQAVLCGVWLATSPPFPDRDMISEPWHIVIQEGSGATFFCVLGFLGFLAGGTFSVAFLARDLPDVFNETKFLTFSMLLFCSVWTAFLPLYHSAQGKSTVAVEIFSILASTAGLLGGIFIPKCYIIC